MKSEVLAVCERDGSSRAYRLLLREAGQLIAQFGDSADLVAAQLADRFFQSGDDEAGRRWTTIFQIVAASHPGGGTARRAEILPSYH